jgi:hypothetical protein
MALTAMVHGPRAVRKSWKSAWQNQCSDLGSCSPYDFASLPDAYGVLHSFAIGRTQPQHLMPGPQLTKSCRCGSATLEHRQLAIYQCFVEVNILFTAIIGHFLLWLSTFNTILLLCIHTDQQ